MPVNFCSSFIVAIELNVSFVDTIKLFPLFVRVMVFYCVMITQNLKENLLGNVCCLARYVLKSVYIFQVTIF